jgi:hypothetical protein
MEMIRKERSQSNLIHLKNKNKQKTNHDSSGGKASILFK